MRRAASIGLLLLYLTIYVEVHQLFKIPVFISHFYEHKQADNSINLLHFIALHYFADKPNGNDTPTDHELPFKGNHCTEVLTSIAVLNDIPYEVKIKSFPVSKTSIPLEVQFTTSSFQISVWQPPRLG